MLKAMRLNHPETNLPPPPTATPVRGKSVFHETGPWCQKGWQRLYQKIPEMEDIRGAS